MAMDSPSRKRPGHSNDNDDGIRRSSKRPRSFSRSPPSSPSSDHDRTKDARSGRSGEHRRRERRDDSREDDQPRRRAHEHSKSRRSKRRSPDEEHDRHERRRKDRSLSPQEAHSHSGYHGSSSRRRRSPSPHARRSRKPLPSQGESFGANRDPERADKQQPKEKPNYKPTGILAAETNKITIGSGHDKQDIVLKYHEPPEARKPPSSDAWRMFVFKGAEPDPLDTIPLASRSCWLLGREKAVADVYIEHPSTSKQHAILQFRYIQKTDEWGEKKGKVGLYVLDLESANGTLLNGKRIEAARYVECRNGDVIKFGESTREYVLVLPPK